MPDLTQNSTILAAALMEGSTDYQQLADAASQGRMSEVIAAFDMPNCGKLFQEVTGLFTTVGMNRIHTQRYENPLAFLEGSYMSYGANIVETAIKWARAHSYSSDAQTLLKTHLPKFRQAFHQIDRAETWPASVSITEFRQSLQPGFGGDDGTGLDTLLGGIFDSMYSPEAYNSLRYTLQTIAEADRAWGGLHRINVAPVTDKTSGENLIALLEELALTWRVAPSTIYNSIDVPVFTDPDDIVILMRPSTLSKIDILTLANVFHESRLEDVRRRIVVVPDFPLPNIEAVIADRNFFVIHRTYFGLESFYNPQKITTNYYLQSQGIWSASPIPNIALLGTFESSEIPVVTVAPTSLVITPDEVTVAPGGTVHINTDLRGTVSGDSIGDVAVKPDSVLWEFTITGEGETEGETVTRELNRNTRIDRFGNLHVQKTGVQVGDTVTVSATSTYINPSGTTNALVSAPVTIELVAATRVDDTYDKLVYTDKNDAIVLNGDIVDAAAFSDED